MMRQRRPVSSSTSRKAAASMLSPGSSLPLGKDQSSYFGRCTSKTRSASPSRASTTMPPAATISSVDSIAATVAPEKDKRQMRQGEEGRGAEEQRSRGAEGQGSRGAGEQRRVAARTISGF